MHRRIVFVVLDFGYLPERSVLRNDVACYFERQNCVCAYRCNAAVGLDVLERLLERVTPRIDLLVAKLNADVPSQYRAARLKRRRHILIAFRLDKI